MDALTDMFRLVISQDLSWFFQIFLYKSLFALKYSWKKRNSHRGKKELACIVSKPLVSCLWGCGESVNPPTLNIQEVQGALTSRLKGDPSQACCPFCSGFYTFVKPQPCIGKTCNFAWWGWKVRIIAVTPCRISIE